LDAEPLEALCVESLEALGAEAPKVLDARSLKTLDMKDLGELRGTAGPEEGSADGIRGARTTRRASGLG
jgi:hypothetical protein